ncbi:MAG: ABC transporter ATP-binding protein, partial [Desulfobacteraceae bacterium]|nr:ABC transporter ATP-binding protein [Desulfobacteraceae bacterium]
MNEQAFIRIEHLTKVFGKTIAVNDISLTGEKGGFITLLGPSGCGKTTMLRMIAGFVQPDEGRMYIGEKLLNELPIHRRETAMVFQSYALFPHLNVFNNVAYGLKLRKVSRSKRKEQVERVLKLVELEGMGNRQISQLSGGQQQRVALSRALAISPRVLLMDEPLSNLDAKLRINVRSQIRNLQQHLGITTIYVTHDQE